MIPLPVSTALTLAFLSALPLNSKAEEAAIPRPVSAADYPNLLERLPFRQVLSLSQSLVLSGIASLPSGKMITVWDRTSGQSYLVTSQPNAQGWILESISENQDLRSASATIAAGDERITVRFDPTRLTPPKLDNTSKPAPRSEASVVVEALLRSLDPSAAREFEKLPATGQESFRKSFSEFLSTYPTASESRRLAFVQRALEESNPNPAASEDPNPSPDPASPAPASPAPASPAPAGPTPEQGQP
jgi:hypothetical protein